MTTHDSHERESRSGSSLRGPSLSGPSLHGPSLRRWYLRLYDVVMRRPAVTLGVVMCSAALASTAVPRIALDMSFRPLFGQDPAALEATRRFESRFGQRSGAYVGAILTPRSWDTSFVESLARASDDAASLPGVVEVVSLPRAGAPVWTSEGAESRLLLEPATPDAVPPPDPAIPAATPDGVSPAAPGGAPAAERDALRALREAPELERVLMSEDGASTVLLARLDVPLQDLDRRTRIIERLQDVVSGHVGDVAEAHWVGISVVEAAYARLVLSGLALSLVLTTAVLLAVLLGVYRRVGAVAVVMAGVSLALPVAVATMVVRDQAITIVNSMVPTMILIIGVADAIHMLECFAGHVRDGRSRDDAVRRMFGDMALPCLLTSLTTVAGVLALETAGIDALRDFGLNVAVGIGAVYVANLLALPALLRILPLERVVAPRQGASPLRAWKDSTSELLVRRPVSIAAVAGLLIAACYLGVGVLDVDQRFNEDVAPDHPVRVAQAAFERDFTGVLGPDVFVRRVDGAPILTMDDRRRLERVVAAVEELPGVIHVESILDLVPSSVPDDLALEGALALREDSRLRFRTRDVLDEDGTGTAIVVRTADIGSNASLELVERIEAVAARELGGRYEARVVGQWWLAQLGLSGLLRDMLVGFATSFVLVLPLLALALRSIRLFAVALVPNLLPPFFALGFMGWTGISVRVGTAMILAIALAIAVDDSIHVLVQLAREGRRSDDLSDQMRRSVNHVGGPLLLTTVVLVAGFLSMRLNGLVAIQDMGVVAAATLTVAFLADVYLLPALYVISRRELPACVDHLSGLRTPAVSDTSIDR